MPLRFTRGVGFHDLDQGGGEYDPYAESGYSPMPPPEFIEAFEAGYVPQMGEPAFPFWQQWLMDRRRQAGLAGQRIQDYWGSQIGPRLPSREQIAQDWENRPTLEQLVQNYTPIGQMAQFIEGLNRGR